jgi:hypothetical protein
MCDMLELVAVYAIIERTVVDYVYMFRSSLKINDKLKHIGQSGGSLMNEAVIVAPSAQR